MRIARSLIPLAAIVSTAASAAMSGASTDRAQSEIRRVMAERLKASLSGDTETVSRLMADDYIQTDISGHAQDKATWLQEYFEPLAALIKSGKFKWDRYDQCNLRFRVDGNVAVVMGRLDAKGTGAKWSPQEHTWLADPTGSFSGSLYFTHVYRRERGKWLLAALQNAVPVGPQVVTEKCN
jgi:ketosteroid isomerase-like protein